MLFQLKLEVAMCDAVPPLAPDGGFGSFFCCCCCCCGCIGWDGTSEPKKESRTLAAEFCDCCGCGCCGCGWGCAGGVDAGALCPAL